MGIFSAIKDKIFGHKRAAPTAGAPQAAPRPAPTQAAPTTPPTAAAAIPAATQASQVDVEAVLQVMADDSGQTLNWRSSIVDLMKLLSIDPSLANRKELAAELGYTGDTDDSASMNIWLHKQVMKKLAENGGLVPDSLRD